MKTAKDMTRTRHAAHEALFLISSLNYCALQQDHNKYKKKRSRRILREVDTHQYIEGEENNVTEFPTIQLN
jgi:hypothetical protein